MGSFGFWAPFFGFFLGPGCWFGVSFGVLVTLRSDLDGDGSPTLDQIDALAQSPAEVLLLFCQLRARHTTLRDKSGGDRAIGLDFGQILVGRASTSALRPAKGRLETRF